MCLLRGAGGTAGGIPGRAIPRVPKAPSFAFPTPPLCRATPQRERPRVPLPPQRASPRAEETFIFARRNAPGAGPRSAPCNSQGGFGEGWRAGERGGRGRGKGAGGQPRRPQPAPGRQLLPAGDVHRDEGIRARAGLAPPCHRAPGPASRALPRGRRVTRGRARLGGRAGAAAGAAGRARPRGVTEWPLASGRVRGVVVVGRCPSPYAPGRPYTGAVSTSRPSGSLTPAAAPTQSPQRRQRGRRCLCPCQRDAQTDSHVGTARAFQRVLTSPTPPLRRVHLL